MKFLKFFTVPLKHTKFDFFNITLAVSRKRGAQKIRKLAGDVGLSKRW